MPDKSIMPELGPFVSPLADPKHFAYSR